MADVVALIPNLNTRSEVVHCVESLLNQDRSLDIHVLDLGSRDGSPDALAELSGSIVIHKNLPNRGYGAALNRGLALTDQRWVICSNSDVVYPRDAVMSLTALADEWDRPAIFGVRLANPDGSPQRSTHALPGRFALVWLFAAWLRYFPQLNGRLLGYLSEEEWEGPTTVGWVTGAVLFAERSVFEALGGFDERFFMNSEEVDFCRRARDAGYDVVYVPGVVVEHAGGASGGPANGPVWLAQGAARYTYKHYGSFWAFISKLGAVASYLMSIPLWMLRALRHPGHARESLRDMKRFGSALSAAVREHPRM